MTGGRVRRAAALVTVAAVAALAGSVGATWSAFSATEESTANRFVAGTVAITDDLAGTSAITLQDAVPGDTTIGCLDVVYEGSLDATVRLHAAVSGALADHLLLTVTRGTSTPGPAGSCAGFTADAADHAGFGPGVVYSGTLRDYPSDWANGIVDPDASGTGDEVWSTDEAHTYRLQATLANHPAAAGQTANAIFHWGAQTP